MIGPDSRTELTSFLRSQRTMAVATTGAEPWICNVYFGIGEDFRVYFISGADEVHSHQILANPVVTFATSWFDPSDHADRKGVQGRGVCTLASSDQDIAKAVALHNANFPKFANRITVDWIRSDDNHGRAWIIQPQLIKFWNDALYGEKHWEEFRFP